MKSVEQICRSAISNVAKLIFLLPFFLIALTANGAIPGVLTPTLGQAVWLTGFAKALLSSSTLTIFAHNIGLPEPAAIAFGLPGALTIAIGLKVGLSPPDAYSWGCLFWLAIAFWGAYALSRSFGASTLYSALGATVWLTFPIVWQHSGYSMLSVGIALLPAYYYSAQRVIDAEPFRLSVYIAFLFFCIVSSFMDGYTFIMFASISLAATLYNAHENSYSRDILIKSLAVVGGFILSFALYTLYTPSVKFRAPIEFFRGWGLDLYFLTTPTKGILWLPDLIGQSTKRQADHLFGDASVHQTTFALIPLALASVLFFSGYGDRRLKLFFFAVGLIACYLSLGPSFKFNTLRPEGAPLGMSAEYAIGPTGTELLWKYIPGLNNMRAVYRWIALALVGFWVVIMLALADRRMPKTLAYPIIALLVVYNIPHPTHMLRYYANMRASFLKLDLDLGKLASVFRYGETVAFLPDGNDFLINFLAPRLGIRSYNIGGDKNAAIAKSHWPRDLRNMSRARTPSAFAHGLLRILGDEADSVAIPYIDLLWAAHRWPYPRDRFDEMRPYVEHLRQSGLFRIIETEHFAIVRLKTEVLGLPERDRIALLNSTECSAVPQRDLARANGRFVGCAPIGLWCQFGLSHEENRVCLP